MRYDAGEAAGYDPHPAQGYASGDFACSGSLLAGRCAFGSQEQAVGACSALEHCQAVVTYHRGAWACA